MALALFTVVTLATGTLASQEFWPNKPSYFVWALIGFFFSSPIVNRSYWRERDDALPETGPVRFHLPRTPQADSPHAHRVRARDIASFTGLAIQINAGLFTMHWLTEGATNLGLVMGYFAARTVLGFASDNEHGDQFAVLGQRGVLLGKRLVPWGEATGLVADEAFPGSRRVVTGGLPWLPRSPRAFAPPPEQQPAVDAFMAERMHAAQMSKEATDRFLSEWAASSDAAVRVEPYRRFGLSTLFKTTSLLAAAAAVLGFYYRTRDPESQRLLLFFWGAVLALLPVAFWSTESRYSRNLYRLGEIGYLFPRTDPNRWLSFGGALGLVLRLAVVLAVCVLASVVVQLYTELSLRNAVMYCLFAWVTAYIASILFGSDSITGGLVILGKHGVFCRGAFHDWHYITRAYRSDHPHATHRLAFRPRKGYAVREQFFYAPEDQLDEVDAYIAARFADTQAEKDEAKDPA